MNDEIFKLVPNKQLYHVFAVSPEVAEANIDRLRGLSVDDPMWRAIVQVAIVVREVLLDNAMRSGDVKHLYEASGVDKLLSKLNEVRQGTSGGEGQV
jgi:hypothetical protein